jgi:hypothetical protein
MVTKAILLDEGRPAIGKLVQSIAAHSHEKFPGKRVEVLG